MLNDKEENLFTENSYQNLHSACRFVSSYHLNISTEFTHAPFTKPSLLTLPFALDNLKATYLTQLRCGIAWLSGEVA